MKKNTFFRKINKEPSSIKEFKPITKNNIGKNIELRFKSTLTTLKPTKTYVASKNKSNKNITINFSLSSKEELQKKTSPNNRNIKNKKNLKKCKTNYNKIKTSNILISSKDKDKDKINKNFRKNYSNFNKININIPELNKDIFNKNFLKETIIIDNEGNNNLNIYINPKNKINYKNIINKRKLIKFNEKNEINNLMTNNENNDLNSLFENSTNSINCNNNVLNIINKENNKNDNFGNITEEEKRLKEYNTIINLLNTNIEQFKKMFNNNKNIINNNKNKNKKISMKNKKNIKTIPMGNINIRKNKIIDFKDKYSNLKKNLSEENIKYNKNKNKNINNLILLNINEDENCKKIIKDDSNINQKNNELQDNNFSFLESSIDNEFYQSLINKTFLQNISHSSLDINIDDISNKENIEINNINKMKMLTDDKNEIIYSKKINEKENINKWFNDNLLLKNKNLVDLNNKQIENDNHKDFQGYINTLMEKISLFFNINKN